MVNRREYCLHKCCVFKTVMGGGILVSIQVRARLGDNVNSLGLLDQNSRNSHFAQIQSAMETFDNICSITILGDLRSSLVGIHAIKNNFYDDDSTCILSPENLPVASAQTILGKSEYGSISPIVSLSPVRISDHLGSKMCLGVVAGLQKARAHRTWLIVQFASAMRIESQKLRHLKSIVSSVQASGSELLRQICCLDPNCNSFGLAPHATQDFARTQVISKIHAKSAPGLSEVFQKLDEFEHLILELMAEGKSNVEIAKSLYVSTSSIRNGSSRIYNKIGARNRQDVVVLFTKYQHLTSTAKS